MSVISATQLNSIRIDFQEKTINNAVACITFGGVQELRVDFRWQALIYIVHILSKHILIC